MQSKENQSKSYRIYGKGTRQLFEVTKKQYIEYDSWRTRIRKKKQYYGECICPRRKWWLCDGMCDDCEFQSHGNVLSMDSPFENSDGDEFTLHDKSYYRLLYILIVLTLLKPSENSKLQQK